jgi:hypothetical protein
MGGQGGGQGGGRKGKEKGGEGGWAVSPPKHKNLTPPMISRCDCTGSDNLVETMVFLPLIFAVFRLCNIVLQ